MRTYSELLTLKTFEDRFEYLKLSGEVGARSFGADRYLNQRFYHSNQWKLAKGRIIIRDEGCDLGVRDRFFPGKLIVHHLNPVTVEQLVNDDPILYDPENLITVSPNTHEAIHYGDGSLLFQMPEERFPWDTAPWRR